jgi:hypothetical protein
MFFAFQLMAFAATPMPPWFITPPFRLTHISFIDISAASLSACFLRRHYADDFLSPLAITIWD